MILPEFDIVDLADELDDNYFLPWEPENVAEVLASMARWQISQEEPDVESWAMSEGYL